MADPGLVQWVSTWDGEKVLHWTISLLTVLIVLRREVRESWEPWRRKRWCRERRKWCQRNPGKAWKVPEDRHEWARWGHEHKLFEMTEYGGSGDLEIYRPSRDGPHIMFLE